MLVLVTSKFDKDLNKMNLLAWRHHFLIISQGHLNPKGVVRTCQNSNLSEILCLSSLPACLTKVESKPRH